MESILAFALALLVAVLVSEFASRSVLSSAAMFLVTGFMVGDSVLGVTSLPPDSSTVGKIAEYTLFAVLFTDGMRLSLGDLRSAWRLPGRALLLGMPLTLSVTAVLAHFVAGLSWIESFLVGAVLSPTDPVSAAAIVGRKGVPQRHGTSHGRAACSR